MKKYVKSKGVYCPACGKSRGVELYEEETHDPTWGSSKDYYIRCRNCQRLYKVMDMGAYPSYDFPSEDQCHT